ncbi:MAG TPA: AAA family ATPase [Tepidisphaeraceae bacterium]|jgi:capsular exopolysaccharide synthesis family protein
MSHDIQLYTNPNLPAVGDDWSQNSTALGPVLGQQGSPIKKVQRLLRGRYLLTGLLAIGGAVAGAMFGWNSQSAKWGSDGIICIKPVIPSISTTERTIQFYDKFVQSQVDVIDSERVLNRAVASPEYTVTQLPTGSEGASKLKRDLDIEYIRGTQHIRVSFKDEKPEVAQNVVRAVIRAYSSLYGEINGDDARSQLDVIKKMIDDTTNTQRGYQSQIDLIMERYGSDDLAVKWTSMQKRLADLEEKLQRNDMLLESANIGGMNGATSGPANENLSLEDLARIDATMRAYLKTADDLSFEIKTMLLSQSKNNPTVQKKAQELELHKQRIDNYAQELRRAFSGTTVINPDQLDKVPLSKDQLDNLKTLSSMLHAQWDKMRDEAKELNVHNSTILKLKDKIKQCEQDLEKYNRRYDEKLAEAAFGGTLAIVEEGGTPVPAPDKRKQMAFVGFVGGGAIPICLLLLIGLMDGRYRYSEEPTADMGGVALLGILPNLPDRLTDPAQAATAAHCVHQIRTMLQINSTEDRKVYAVTSASPGDGKTSLTLALGLSFAASGSRTLLIDCDLVGAGLTARLDMNGPEGVLEAMSQRSLLPYIRTTDVSDLAMLPVGTAQAHHAGMFSPAALRRVLDEARKHFDIVLIDSGPILGSIEATPACASSDGVILTVSRGQQRPLVEKAMSHLRSIGARFAGVVFNRAQTKDFEKSVSGISLRSISRQNDTIHGRAPASNGGGFRKADAASSGKAFGPVARAVASSVKSPDQQDS